MAGILLKNNKQFWYRLVQQVCEASHTRNVSAARFCHSSSKVEKDEELDTPSLIYKDTSSEYGTGKKYAVAKLQELFNLRLFTAVDLATRFKKLRLVTGKTMSDNYQLLRQEGITNELLLKYPDVLAQRGMEEKMLLLKSLPFEINDTLPLLTLEINKFKLFINNHAVECKSESGGRIEFLSKLLELPVLEICYVITERTFLCNIDLDKVKMNYKLLTDFGVGIDAIRRDYWVLQYNTDVIRHRLELAKEHKVDEMKTWMVRAQLEIFHNYIQRRSDNKLILGEYSLAEYLSERLQCTVEQARIILKKHPALSNKSMRKMKEIIDFLYADGYTPIHIYRNPKILLHSVETTRKRVKELEEQGMKVSSLHILTKSQKQYMQYYDNLVKANKSKIKDTI